MNAPLSIVQTLAIIQKTDNDPSGLDALIATCNDRMKDAGTEFTICHEGRYNDLRVYDGDRRTCIVVLRDEQSIREAMNNVLQYGTPF